MINKQSIYYWFFFPLLALLSAGSLTSCIYDSVLEETDMSGKSTLSITMRGITTTDPGATGSYDDYVKTLRVIGFDANGSVVCNELHEGTDFAIINDALNITQTMIEAFQGGVCDFYFIANEEGYKVYDSQTTLSNYLVTPDLQKESLDNCLISTPTRIATLGSSPILMTTSVRSTLKPGDNTINNIELVRCFAKAQLLLKVESEVTKPVSTKVSLCVPAPDSFYLLPGKEEVITSTTPLSYYTISGGSQPMNTELITSDYFFISEVVYLPEHYLSDNTPENAVKYQITLDKAYEVPIADDTTGNLDYSIKRNYAYTTIGTYAPASEAIVTLEWKVDSYDEVNVDVPTFE